MMAYAVFWISCLGLLYIYVGYPALIVVLARLRPRPVTRTPMRGRFSIVIAAHNEEAVIARKLKSILDSEQGKQVGEIIVVSDGSTDETVGVVRQIRDERIRVLSFDERRGKPTALNEAIPLCRHDCVVLTDARQELHPQALGRLLECLADPSVGVVSGELVFRKPKTIAGQGVESYWTYEKLIRKSESCFHSVPGATGALYAIRKELFMPIPGTTLLDDVVIPMQAVVRGRRCIFEAGAIAYDVPSQKPEQELLRKRRTIAGIAQLLRLFPGWILPWRNPIWWQYLSHKLLRLASPFLLVALAVSSLLLWLWTFSLWYAGVVAAQAVLYVCAAVGFGFSRLGRTNPLFSVPYMFVLLNGITCLALWDAIQDQYCISWGRSTSVCRQGSSRMDGGMSL